MLGATLLGWLSALVFCWCWWQEKLNRVDAESCEDAAADREAAAKRELRAVRADLEAERGLRVAAEARALKVTVTEDVEI